MTTDTSASGADQNTSASGQTDDSSGSNNQQTEDKVAYTTYKRAISEVKNLKGKLQEANDFISEYKAKQEAAEKAELESQGKFKELLEAERKKNEELTGKVNGLFQERVDMVKLNGFLKALDGTIGEQYLGLVDLDMIKFDAETKQLDEMSVAETVEHVRKTFPRIIETAGTTTGLPTNAASNGSSGSPSYEEWESMPLEDMKKHMASVIQNEKE